MEFIFNDGGRADTGYKGSAGDCAVRAIAIATGIPYGEVYDTLKKANGEFAKTKRCRVARKLKKKGSSPRDGNYKKVYRQYLESLGWKWVPTMFIGQGTKVHLKKDELPDGKLIVNVSKHLTAVIDGVIHDTYDCSRDETRCVYGYYIKN